MTTETEELDSQSGFRDFLVDEVGLSKRPANALAESCNGKDDLVAYLRNNHKPSNIDGVGSRSSQRVWSWFKDEHPGANRERLEKAEEYCTEFTTDHEIPETPNPDTGFQFAFVCPRCDEKNALVGDPRGFRNKPFMCENCRYVPLLHSQYLEEFAQEEYDNE